jgi:capsular polysaccharide biosynthesis protein/predicted Ser/Thr protein kinase
MDTIDDNDPMPIPPQTPLGGLDPADLLKQGVAHDTFTDGAPSSFHPPAIEDLAAIFPQFEILELIGKGGMGAVYKVRQRDLDRIVALKILPPAIGHSPEFSNRFTREAKALAKLNHPGIVTLHEFGQRDGLYFILMEFVDGVNLAQLMKTGRISPREALAIVPQICDALQSAHDQGIVHRDIKPENILLDRLGRVKVADFGIAKVVEAVCDPIRSGDTPVPTDHTLAGKIIGTPKYMAPEQIDRPAEVDHRADIYALGVVFYQMLTGELPGKDLQAPSKKVHIDVRLDEIVLRAMEKQPELRYQTAHEFRTVIEGVHPLPPALPLPKRGMLRRWWWVFLIMIPLGLLLGLAAGAVWAYIIPKKYEAETIIEVVPRDAAVMSPGFFARQFEAIASRESLAAVAQQLELPNRWNLSQKSVVQMLKGIVSVQNIRGTDLLSIRVRHTSKQDAAAIAAAVAKNYQRSFPGNAVIHEEPLEPLIPVSPNVGLIVAAGGLLGLILSPLLALILIVFLQIIFGSGKPAGYIIR